MPVHLADAFLGPGRLASGARGSSPKGLPAGGGEHRGVVALLAHGQHAVHNFGGAVPLGGQGAPLGGHGQHVVVQVVLGGQEGTTDRASGRGGGRRWGRCGHEGGWGWRASFSPAPTRGTNVYAPRIGWSLDRPPRTTLSKQASGLARQARLAPSSPHQLTGGWPGPPVSWATTHPGYARLGWRTEVGSTAARASTAVMRLEASVGRTGRVACRSGGAYWFQCAPGTTGGGIEAAYAGGVGSCCPPAEEEEEEAEAEDPAAELLVRVPMVATGWRLLGPPHNISAAARMWGGGKRRSHVAFRTGEEAARKELAAAAAAVTTVAAAPPPPGPGGGPKPSAAVQPGPVLPFPERAAEELDAWASAAAPGEDELARGWLALRAAASGGGRRPAPSEEGEAVVREALMRGWRWWPEGGGMYEFGGVAVGWVRVRAGVAAAAAAAARMTALGACLQVDVGLVSFSNCAVRVGVEGLSAATATATAAVPRAVVPVRFQVPPDPADVEVVHAVFPPVVQEVLGAMLVPACSRELCDLRPCCVLAVVGEEGEAHPLVWAARTFCGLAVRGAEAEDGGGGAASAAAGPGRPYVQVFQVGEVSVPAVAAAAAAAGSSVVVAVVVRGSPAARALVAHEGLRLRLVEVVAAAPSTAVPPASVWQPAAARALLAVVMEAYVASRPRFSLHTFAAGGGGQLALRPGGGATSLRVLLLEMLQAGVLVCCGGGSAAWAEVEGAVAAYWLARWPGGEGVPPAATPAEVVGAVEEFRRLVSAVSRVDPVALSAGRGVVENLRVGPGWGGPAGLVR